MTIAHNLERIEKRIASSCAVYGHAREDITLVAVTKTVEEDRIREAIRCGVKHVGENRVQEMLSKYDSYEGADVHLIGQLQSNKVRNLPGKVSLIHSVDRLSLLKELERIGKREEFVFQCLIELNIAEEASKAGASIEDLDRLLDYVETCEFVKVRGLMTIAPFVDDPETIRPVFRTMREIFDKLSKVGYNNSKMDFLSMGMSGDYAVALEEGSNMIRIGSAIFGERIYTGV